MSCMSVWCIIEYGKFGRIRAYEDFGYWIIWPSYACTTQEQLTIFCNENFRQTEGNLGLILLILNPCWWYFAFKLSLWRRFDFRCKVVRKWWSLCSWKFRRHIFTYCHLLLIESKPDFFKSRSSVFLLNFLTFRKLSMTTCSTIISLLLLCMKDVFMEAIFKKIRFHFLRIVSIIYTLRTDSF